MAPEAMQETFMSDSEDEGGWCINYIFPSFISFRYVIIISSWPSSYIST